MLLTGRNSWVAKVSSFATTWYTLAMTHMPLLEIKWGLELQTCLKKQMEHNSKMNTMTTFYLYVVQLVHLDLLVLKMNNQNKPCGLDSFLWNRRAATTSTLHPIVFAWFLFCCPHGVDVSSPFTFFIKRPFFALRALQPRIFVLTK